MKLKLNKKHLVNLSEKSKQIPKDATAKVAGGGQKHRILYTAGATGCRCE